MMQASPPRADAAAPRRPASRLLAGLRRPSRHAATVVGLLLLAAVTVTAQDREVVVYVSHDEEHSREILESFAAETGIAIKPLFDTEATKTVGLVTRLINEGTPAKADVFWNNEVGQTLRLRSKGLLEPYVSPNAASIPDAFKDPEGYWTGFAARARVLIWNREMTSADALPRTLEDLVRPEFAKGLSMARPRTGTTLTHAGALFAVWGEERTRAWFERLITGGTRWEGGNGPVARTVAEGTRPYGMTDTDDANGMREDGMPVDILLLDQEEGGLGTLVIPNTVMVMKGAPHGEEARALVDYLLRPEVEARLARGRAAQIPLHPGVEVPDNVLRLDRIRHMTVRPDAIGAAIEAHADGLEALFEEKHDAPGGSAALLVPLIALGLIVLLVVLRSRGAFGGGSAKS